MPPNSARPGRTCARSAWPPKPLARFVERHVMAALGGDGGGFHAGRAAASDHDLLRLRGRVQRAVGQLAPGLGCWMQEIG